MNNTTSLTKMHHEMIKLRERAEKAEGELAEAQAELQKLREQKPFGRYVKIVDPIDKNKHTYGVDYYSGFYVADLLDKEVYAAPVAAHAVLKDDVALANSRVGRVYIAGPMTGIEGYNFPAFNAEADRLRATGLTVCNPADHGIVDGASWEDYLRYDIGVLATCERIHLLPGWDRSKGVALEIHIAAVLGMHITYADGASQLSPNCIPAPAPAVHKCRGITDASCHYLAVCGDICNKCGREHSPRVKAELVEAGGCAPAVIAAPAAPETSVPDGDDFNGTTPHLILCMEALVRLDAKGLLVPHSIGRDASRLLSAAANRLRKQTAPSVPDVLIRLRDKVKRIPQRKEYLGGQQFAYVRICEVIGEIDALLQSAEANHD